MQSIDVQLTEDDKKLLIEYSNKIELPNCYLEIGVYQGGSASVVLESAKPEIELYGVDILDNFKLKDTRFNFIHKASLEAVRDWNKPIGMLFIDGHHDEAGEDFNVWEKFVVGGGYILFHDYARHSPRVIEDCDKIYVNKNYKVVRCPRFINDTMQSSIFIIKKLGKSIFDN